METYRLILIIVVMSLCITDLVMTAYYVHTYRKWQPNKPYKLIELNPVLVFLWNNLGFVIGMIVGSILLLTLNFLIAKNTYWIIPIILIGYLVWTIINHFKNFHLLFELIKQYPLGHLPVEVFGNVTGNN
jgi:hypothetical protein